jgi:hypothetical protein
VELQTPTRLPSTGIGEAPVRAALLSRALRQVEVLGTGGASLVREFHAPGRGRNSWGRKDKNPELQPCRAVGEHAL